MSQDSCQLQGQTSPTARQACCTDSMLQSKDSFPVSCAGTEDSILTALCTCGQGAMPSKEYKRAKQAIWRHLSDVQIASRKVREVQLYASIDDDSIRYSSCASQLQGTFAVQYHGNSRLVGWQGVEARPLSQIPHSCSVVLAACRHVVAVWRESCGEDSLHMALQDHDAPTAPQVPNPTCSGGLHL